jgi:lipid A oxidase
MKTFSRWVMGVVLASAATVASAEAEFTVFGGIQGAPHSNATVRGGGADEDLRIQWEGRSLKMAPYYGLRYTRWTSNDWGWAVTFNHSKVYASDSTLAKEGYTVLEMSDGLNPLTLNLMYRHRKGWGGFEPYAGAGIGISVPHVELQKGPADTKTYEYQYAGPVVALTAGLKYPLGDKWSLMAEYQFHHHWIDAKMKPDSRFRANIITNALNLGVAYRW